MRISVQEEVVVVRSNGLATVCVQQTRTVTLTIEDPNCGDVECEPECDDCGGNFALCRCMPGEG